MPAFKEALAHLDFVKMFGIVTYDSEFLYIPPITGDTLSTLNTKNKSLMLSMMVMFKAPG